MYTATHDHHLEDSAARLGPLKALRFASPHARAAGALTGPRSSRVGLLLDGRQVVTVTRWRRSDKCLTTAAAGTGQAREAPTHAGSPARVFQRAGAPTEGRLELGQRSRKMKLGASAKLGSQRTKTSSAAQE